MTVRTPMPGSTSAQFAHICTASTRALLKLAHGQLKLNRGRSSPNLIASGCSCSRSVSLAVLILGPSSSEQPRPVCAEKNVKSTRPCWGSQFRDPLQRMPGGDSSSPAACWCSRMGPLGMRCFPKLCMWDAGGWTISIASSCLSFMSC